MVYRQKVYFLCGVSLFVIIALGWASRGISLSFLQSITDYNVYIYKIDAGNGRTRDSNDRQLNTKAMYAIPSLKTYFQSAYIDDRTTPPLVRIFGIRPNEVIAYDLWCEWSGILEGTANITWQVRATTENIYDEWPRDNRYLAFMVTCPVESGVKGLRKVKVYSRWIKESVEIPVRIPRPLPASRKKTIAVCVKPVTGQFPISRIIEWFEIQRASGLSDFIIYNTDLFGASRFVLEYYQNLGLATVVSFPFLTAVLRATDGTENLDSQLRYALYQQVYIVALQDCLYRFRHQYRYLSIIDMDEVILPSKDESFPVMLRRAHREVPSAIASYMFLTAWHYREFTNNKSDEKLYMQKFAWSPPPSMHQPKSVIVANLTITINYHCVLKALTSVHYYVMPWQKYGYVHHFRDGTCSPKFDKEHCQKWVKQVRQDPVIMRYSNVTSRNVAKVSQQLGI